MADGLTINTGFTLTKGSLKLPSDAENRQVTVAGTGVFIATIDVGTGEVDISITGVTTPGWVKLQNLDGTNYVKFGPRSGGALVEMGRLSPNEPPAQFRMGPSGVTLRMIANAAMCKVLVKVISD